MGGPRTASGLSFRRLDGVRPASRTLRRILWILAGVFVAGTCSGGGGARTADRASDALGHSGIASGDSRGAILFVHDRDEGHPYGLYLVNADGSGLRLAVANADEARWSPDGSAIAFSRDALEVLTADGNGARRLAGPADSFAWSPDGARIAYADKRRGGIYVVGFDGNGERRISSQNGRFLAWSPDGRTIAFARFRGFMSTGIYVVDADRGDERLLLPNASKPEWSPGGSKILFERDTPQLLEDLYVANSNGSNERKLTVEPTHYLVAHWSPDGSAIAFSDDVDDKTFVVKPDGSGLKLVDPQGTGASWSPDGTSLALLHAVPDFKLWVVAADGSWRRPVTKAGFPVTKAGSFPSYTYVQWHPRGIHSEQLVGLFAPPEPTASVAQPRVLRTRQEVFALAADGQRAAVAYNAGPNCLELWQPSNGKHTRFQESNFCGGGFGEDGFLELALAGTRLAWLTYVKGHHLYLTVSAASLKHRRPRDVAEATDTQMGDLRGHGGLLVFDTWKWFRQGKANGVLWRVKGNAAKRIRSARTGLTALAADGHRVAVLRSNGGVQIVRDDGRLLATLAVRERVVGLVFQGTQAVVLTPNSLLTYDIPTGVLEHRWTLGAEPARRLVGLAGGVAAYAEPGTIHLLRLTDGRRAALDVPGTHAVLTGAGLFYAYTLADRNYPGRVEFVPLRALLRKLR